MRRNGLALVVGVLATVTLASMAFGGDRVQVPVSFDLSPDTCSQIPAGTVIHGEGTAEFNVTPSGNVHAVIKGQATDGNGGSWGFNYSDSIRPTGADSVELTDHFNLVGSGSSIKLHSHFVGVFTNDGDLITLKQIHGDPIGCDPI